MSAIIPVVVFEFAKARSDFIDAHNMAELSVRQRLERHGKPTNHLLGKNIEALSKVPANPQYAKKDKMRVDALLDELRHLHSIRCDVVHSRMQTLSVDGLTHGFFFNVQKTLKYGRTGTLLSLSQMNECTEHLIRIAKDLEA